MGFNMIASRKHIVMIAVLTTTTFGEPAFADRVVKPFSDSRSQTEGYASATCSECWTQTPMSLEPFRDLRDVMKKVAIFDADPNTPEFDDPRTEMNLTENPQLRAISVVRVTAKLAKPPRGVLSGAEDVRQVGPQTYAGNGTSFMINECLMITNHHVVNISSDETDVSDRKIEVFQRDQAPDGTFGAPTKTDGTLVASGSYRGEKDYSNDWAVIKLNQNRRDRQGIIPICTPTEEQAIQVSKLGRVSSASFFTDKGEESSPRLFGQKGCRIFGKSTLDQNAWSTNCAAIPGTSGSPVFATSPAGKSCALGMLTATSTKDTKASAPNELTHNILIPFSHPVLKEQIRTAMLQNKCG
jgi:hypothetical protein